jgi:aldehyde:ferredoxin oxidoreductase
VRQPIHGFGRSKELGDYFGVPGGYLEGEAKGKHRNVYDGIERETVWVQHNQSLKNSLPICELASPPGQFFHPPEMDIRIFESRALSTVTGITYDVEKLWEAGERIYNIRRAIMVLRENRHRDDDTLNPIWYKSTDKVDVSKLAATKGQTLSKPLCREKWEALKDRYYKLRGWDVATGVPTKAKLEELGMTGVADKLQNAGKLN